MLPVSGKSCECPCHETDRATTAAARQMLNYAKAFTHAGRMKYHEPPLVIDHIEAVSACESCINAHCPAIVSPWPLPTPKPANFCYDPGEGSE